MNKIDLGLDLLTDEQHLLRDAAARYLAGEGGLARLRALRCREPGYSPQAWRDMAGLGWHGLRVPERFGGSAMGPRETTLLLEELGRALAPEPVAACAVMAAAALAEGDNAALQDTWLPRLATGEFTPTLAWQDTPQGPGASHAPVQAEPLPDGGLRLRGVKHGVAAGECAHAFIVSARTSQGTVLCLVDREAPGLSVRSVPRVDGGFWSTLHLDAVTLPRSAVVASAACAQSVLEQALDEGRLAMAAELLGLMSHALESAVDYLQVREQFGRRIGSFQVLQHCAVDLLMQVELSRSVVIAAAAAFATGDPQRRAMAASQAKARCAEAALKVTRACVQLHGGIGYTDECDIGLFVKRAMVLAGWLGGVDAHRQRYLTLSSHGSAATEPQALPERLEGVREWMRANFPADWRFPPHRLTLGQTKAWHRLLAAQGWVAPNWPQAFGGMGLAAHEQIALQDEFDRHGIDIAVNMGVLMLGPLLIRYGTEAQQREHLPKILSGEVQWCQGYSEPGAGSDLASLRTRADLQGDHFVVNGQKTWTSLAHEADWIFLLVRTDPQARKQQGISFLLVDMKTPGITVRRIRNLVGTDEFCEVFFDNVKVPAAQLVGELNQGWTMAKSLLGSERIMIGNPRVARFPLQLMGALARADGHFADPVFATRYAELLLDVDDLATAFVRCADVLRRGDELGPAVSMLKIWITETWQRVAELMLRTWPERAALEEPLAMPDGTAVNLAHQVLASLPSSIYSGSNEILRNVLAKAVLRLPDA